MKFFLISDNVDTKVGMRLAGIDGVVVHERDEVLSELEKAKSDTSIGIVLLTEKLAALIPQKIADLKLNSHLPLVVVIPDRHGTIREEDSITRYVREAVGLKI